MSQVALIVVLALNFLEWLDFTLYLYLSKSVFSKLFFPDSVNSLMWSFAIFAIAYLMRPLGGWYFGRQADLIGRRKPMISSAKLMAGATFIICFLPDYETIGLWAPFGLLMARMMQAFAIGETQNSGMYILEHQVSSPLKVGSYVAMSGALGMFMGGVIAALLQYANSTDTWRIIFALIGIISLFVCYFRRMLRESPEFSRALPISFRTFWHTYQKGIFNIGLIASYVSIMVYMSNIYWVSFATKNKLLSPVWCTWLGALAQLFSAIWALFAAHLFKPNQIRTALKASGVSLSVAAPLLFYATSHELMYGVFLGLIGYVLANGFVCSVLFYFLYSQLPVQYRCRGVSIVWGIAASLGALCLPLAEKMSLISEQGWVIGFLVSITAWIMILSVIRTT